MTTIEDPAILSPAEARARYRAGTSTPSAGWAAGHTQANLIAVPADWAPPFAITHAPGHMFITDVPDTDYRVGRCDPSR